MSSSKTPFYPYFIKFYQFFLSPFFHLLNYLFFGQLHSCRFIPTCSEYSRQAFQQYGLLLGLKLSVLRLLRCHPLNHSPINDPLPAKIR